VLNVHSSRPILAGIAKKLEPPKPLRWDMYRAAAKLRPLGAVEAADADEAIDKAAQEFASKLIAAQRR
jgi:hypothetical protein